MLQWKIGDIKISQLVEMTLAGAHVIMPDATPENLAEMTWLKPHFVNQDDQPILNIQMLIIETPNQKLVVDTCVGNDKNINMEGWANMQLPFLDNLKKMGHDPDSVDKVICTHLHADHVGWNTVKKNGKWVPTFPNARYLAVEEEFEFWRSIEEDPIGDVFGESVKPVIDAGQLDLVKKDHQVCEGIWFESTPGHTPGHVSVRIMSGGEEAFITGDMMHHPCQIGRPDWPTVFDADVEHSIKTRHQFLEHYADKPILILGTHFADPVAGNIVRDGNTYRFKI